jgi:hypothetical protein
MEVQAEEQLNKLINAYNFQENQPDEEVDEMMRASLDIAAFEMRFKKIPPKSSAKKQEPRTISTAANTTSITKHAKLNQELFDKIYIPPLPENLKTQFRQEELRRDLEKVQETQMPSIQDKLGSMSLNELREQIERLKIEEESIKNEPFEKRIREAGLKNKNLGMMLQKERVSRIELETQKIALEKQIDELKIKLKMAVEPESEDKRQMMEYKLKVQHLEEKVSILNLKLTTNENELAKCVKIIKSEVGYFQSLDEVLRAENNWKGRAQKIEILKAKVHQLKTTLAEFKMPEVESSSANTLKKKSLVTSETKIQELLNLKGENELLKSELEKTKAKTKGLASRNQILESELKTIKTDMESSKKILIDKSKNDDIYIKALKSDSQKMKSEIERLRIESQFNIGNKENLSNFSNANNELEKVILSAEKRKLPNVPGTGEEERAH